MLTYEPKRWIRLIFSWQGTVLPRILPRMLAVGGFATLVAIVEHHVIPLKPFEGMPLPVLGLVLGFLVVLRTNTAYDRFWEGRKLWGGIVNSTRNLVRQALAFTGEGKELAELIVAYTLALKQRLRRENDLAEVRPWVSPSQFEELAASANPPLSLSYQITLWIERQRRSGVLSDILVRHLDERVRELMDYQGGCERILRTPIPFNYAVHIKQFLMIYLFTLPIGLVPNLGWYAVPTTLMIAFGLIGIEEAGVEVEDPFGYDPNDLPLEAICANIEREILALAEAPTRSGTLRTAASPTSEAGPPSQRVPGANDHGATTPPPFTRERSS